MLIVIPTINIHLTYLHVVRSMLNVDETFNMAQALCTSALAASYVNRLNVFFLYLKDRLAIRPIQLSFPLLLLQIFVASHERQ